MQDLFEKALSGDLGTLANLATIGGFLIVVVGIIWGIIWACLKFGRRKVASAVKGKPAWPLICPDGIKPERTVLGRNTEVRQLHIALDSQTAAAIIPGAIVKGAGGLGKTTLARFYVEQYGSHYAGIWWIDADRPDAIVTSLCNLAGRLDATVDSLAGREALAQKALAHLRGQPNPWLLIFDNAHGPRALRGWLPEAGHIHILVTTREGGWPEERFKLLRTGELDFSTEDSPAVALLMQEAGRTADPAGARALAETLGGLPLALVNAGAYLHDAPDVSFAAYAEEWERAIKQAPPEEGDYELSVFGSVSLSLERLSPEATQIANILAFWAPEGLEPVFFKAVGAKDPEHEHRKPISDDLWPILRAEGAVAQAFAELARRSILERRGEGEAAHFAMHRLTGAVIRARLEAEGRAGWREAAGSVLAAAYPQDAGFHEHWPACAALTPHVQALAGHGADSAAADYLYNLAAIYLGQMRQDLSALMLARASLRAKKRRLDPLHRDIGGGYTTLGTQWRNLDRSVIAEKLLARAAVIAEQNLETTDETKSLRFSNHGTALEDRGRRAQTAGKTAEAADWFRRAARRHQWALLLDRRRGDRRAAAYRLNNLGTLRDAQGRRAAAIRLGRMTLKIRREVLAPGDPLLAASLHNLAARLLQTLDWRDAEPLLGEALAICEDAFAAYPRHPDRVDTAKFLATAALMRGDRVKAEAIIERYPDDLDLGKLERVALARHVQIKTDSGVAGPEVLKEILDLMGLTGDDARRILPVLFQPPDPT
jgi:tetratricopeptide (TPR) repeat protein